MMHPPGPSSLLRNTNALEFLEALVRDYGDVVRYANRLGNQVYFFNHPDHVQAVLSNHNFERTSLLKLTVGSGLLQSEGELWHTERRLMQPLFHDHCLPGFAKVVIDYTLSAMRRWEPLVAEGTPFDFSAEMRRLTLEIIVDALFSVQLGDRAMGWSEAVTFLVKDLGAIAGTQFNLETSFSPSRNALFQQALQTLEGDLYRIMAARRAMPNQPRDLLTLLLQAKDAKTGQPLDDGQIRDEMMTMMVAGHETTAIILAWIWYSISQNPAVEQEMLSEIDTVLQERIPTMADLPALSYTLMALQEAMRVYPPVSVTARQTVTEDEIAGYKIPARSVVIICAYTTHRHRDFWENPDFFDPGRFTPEKCRDRHRHAYFPFLSGRHLCIGQSFALLESQLIVALLAQSLSIRPVAGQSIKPLLGVTLRMQDGMMVTAEKRFGAARSELLNFPSLIRSTH